MAGTATNSRRRWSSKIFFSILLLFCCLFEEFEDYLYLELGCKIQGSPVAYHYFFTSEGYAPFKKIQYFLLKLLSSYRVFFCIIPTI